MLRTACHRIVAVLALIPGLLIVCPPTLHAHSVTDSRLTGHTEGHSPADTPKVHTDCPVPVKHNCVDSLNPNPIEWLTGPSEACITAFKSEFKDWAVTFNWTHPSKGTIDLLAYEAVDYTACHQGVMGAYMKAEFKPAADDNIHRFRWVQIVSTNDPLPGQKSPRVDGINAPSKPEWGTADDKPFYWNEGHVPAGDTVIWDYPRRECPCPGMIVWRAETYLTDWYTVPTDPLDKHLIIYDGFRWGFDIVCVPLPNALWGGFILLSLLLARRHRCEPVFLKA